MSSARNATRIIGPIVAEILVAGAGSGRAIAVDAATYALAALCLLRLNVSSAPKAARTPLVGGLSYFRSVRWLWPVSLAFFAVNLVHTGPWQILGLRIAGPQGGARDWGLVLSARGRRAPHHERAHIPTGSAPSPARRPARQHRVRDATPGSRRRSARQRPHRRALIGGAGSSASAIACDSALQEHIQQNKLSRVASIDDLFSYAAIPIGQLAAGPLASQLGPANVCLTAALLWITAVLTPLGNRAVRNLTTQRPTSTDDTPTGVCSH